MTNYVIHEVIAFQNEIFLGLRKIVPELPICIMHFVHIMIIQELSNCSILDFEAEKDYNMTRQEVKNR